MNKVADALSRRYDNPELPKNGITLDTAQISTEKVSWYTRMHRKVSDQPGKFLTYKIVENQLYKQIWNNVGRRDQPTTSPWKLCIPRERISELLKLNHDDPTAGHQGIAKTYARISKSYYWPGMFRDIAKYVRTCECCMKFKHPNQLKSGEMQFRCSTGPWSTVSTDLVGPFPRSTKGNCYLVMFQDTFTKWVECAAIRAATARAVGQVFKNNVVLRHGTPNILISDNGTQYTSSLFEEISKEYGITHRFTPPYTPQANPVERTNKVIETMIAQYLSETQRKWDELLPEFMFAINTSSHSSTGFSPAYLNYGRELRTPQTVHLPPELIQDTDPRLKAQEMQSIFKLVRDNLVKAHGTQRHYYNLRRRPYKPKVGDKVYCRERHISQASKAINAKLLPKYSGPHLITKVISPVVIEI